MTSAHPQLCSVSWHHLVKAAAVSHLRTRCYKNSKQDVSIESRLTVVKVNLSFIKSNQQIEKRKK